MPKPLSLLAFRCYNQYTHAFVERMVRNNTNRRLENVQAVALHYTKDGTFITSHDALIDYNPIMPGQESPVRTIGTWNPQMATCKLNFKESFGGTIPHELRKYLARQ